MRSILNTAYRLAKGVQVRKEARGLLFYSQAKHGVCFIESKDWLYPRHLDGTWTLDCLVEDIAMRTGIPARAIEPPIVKLLNHLVDSRIIVDEPC